MNSTEQNNALKSIIEKLPQDEFWIPYKRYCEFRIKGLRPQALKQIDAFIDVLQVKKFETRVFFIKTLLENAELVPSGDYGPMPHNLKEKVIRVTLNEWSMREPTNPLPLRWLAKFFLDHAALSKALEVAPSDQMALKLDLEWKIGHLYESTHHLPHYYIGDVDSDMDLAIDVALESELIEDEKIKAMFQREFIFYNTLMLNYKEWKSFGNIGSFKAWGAQNNKLVDSGIRAYYYEKKSNN